MFPKRKIPKEIFYIFGVLLFLFLLNLIGALRPIRKLVERVMVIPIMQDVYDFKRSFKKNLSKSDSSCEKQIAELNTKIAALSAENKEQKRLLSSPLPGNWQYTTAKVIDTSREELVINLGKSEGIKEGMVAISGNTYLGKVSLVSEQISKIQMSSFYDSKLSVKIFSNDTMVGRGLLMGRGEGRMNVEQILSNETVKKDDLVVVDEYGGVLSIGTIEDVVQNKGDVFKTAQVKRLFIPEELDTVFIIKGKI